MIALAAEGRTDWIAMHQLSIPADPRRTLPADRDPIEQIKEWLEQQIGIWQAAGLDLSRIVFDPGVGFGKTPLQSLEIVRRIEAFVRADLRVLVGHSRKSFMSGLGDPGPASRDLITIGSSLELASRGVDILRVHNVPDHVLAYRGFAHASPA